MSDNTHILLPVELARRFDLYGPVHKGIRRAQMHLLVRVGAHDFTDGAATESLLADLRRMLFLSAGHLAHEEQHIHAALAASGEAARLEEQHDGHEAAFAVLERLLNDIETAPDAARIALGRQLYLEYSHFIGEDLLHMHEEETVAWPMLCARYSDAELMGIEQRIVGSIPPEKAMAFMALMMPALNPQERFGMLSGMKAGAPAEMFNAVMDTAVKPALAAAEFAALEQRLGLAA